jgi:hypothetical protein
MAIEAVGGPEGEAMAMTPTATEFLTLRTQMVSWQKVSSMDQSATRVAKLATRAIAVQT